LRGALVFGPVIRHWPRRHEWMAALARHLHAVRHVPLSAAVDLFVGTRPRELPAPAAAKETMTTTLPSLLDERARATPDGTAFVAGERAAVSWRALAVDVDALAAALASPRLLGLAPGDRVAVIGQTTAESAIAALAIVAA